MFASNANRHLPSQPIKIAVVFHPNFWILVQEPVSIFKIVDRLSIILVGITVQPAQKIVMFAVMALVNALSACQLSPWEAIYLVLATPIQKSNGIIVVPTSVLKLLLVQQANTTTVKTIAWPVLRTALSVTSRPGSAKVATLLLPPILMITLAAVNPAST